ncbi:MULTISPECIES: nicotinamide riboside transporter PnuC [Weissella]|uniref:Nicotinamide riboside transporter PnuC n=1 Tax=Weissella fermenti TaxID=2987699 RepID=A0ABT6D637_9LACO|nr:MULTISPECIES: nicotinamide riboside transporter PnuC [Weissella]MCW0928033.1 nicotinamide riboside transporter PnuC [Weissella sp. LMG 11983]MDF9300623.1 nicotinamide riboside transporter PnuC [Weissella sp. BK2]
MSVLRELITLDRREHLLALFMILSSAIAFIFQHDFSLIGWVGLVTSIASVLNLILVDRGRLTNFCWGLISTGTWLVIAVHNNLIGDISSQLFYFLSQFVGIAVWHRSISISHTDYVKPKKLSPQMMILTILMAILLYSINVYLANFLHGKQIYLDATLLVLGIIGQLLMTYGYRSQWAAWIMINVINVVIWSVQLKNGGPAATSMLVLQVMMLINSLYGTYLWFRPK